MKINTYIVADFLFFRLPSKLTSDSSEMISYRDVSNV